MKHANILRAIASKIPLNVIDDIFKDGNNKIRESVPIRSNPNIIFLGHVWYRFVDKQDEDQWIGCKICLEHVKNEFTRLEPYLKELCKQKTS